MLARRHAQLPAPPVVATTTMADQRVALVMADSRVPWPPPVERFEVETEASPEVVPEPRGRRSLCEGLACGAADRLRWLSALGMLSFAGACLFTVLGAAALSY